MSLGVFLQNFFSKNLGYKLLRGCSTYRMQTDSRGTLATMVGSFADQYNCCSLHFAVAQTADLPGCVFTKHLKNEFFVTFSQHKFLLNFVLEKQSEEMS
jgi:hypothetical protein